MPNLLKTVLIGVFGFASCGFGALPIEIGLLGVPERINPAEVNTLVEWTVLYNLTRGLIGGGANGTLEPGLARSWKVEPDGKTVHFEMRPNQKFSDGSPLTARDVEATFLFQLRRDGSNKLRLRQVLKSIRVESDDSLTLVFMVPAFSALSLLNIPDFGILPSRNLNPGDAANEDALIKSWKFWAVTSGDYFVKSVDKNGSIHLVKNPFAPAGGDSEALISPIQAPSDPASWFKAKPNRVLRLPILDSTRKSAENPHHSAVSSPFWVRTGFFGPNSHLSSTAARLGVRSLLRRAILKLNPREKWYLIPPLIRPSASGEGLAPPMVPLLKSLPLRFVVNGFSFEEVQRDIFESRVKSELPKAIFEWKNSPAEFMSRIQAGHFDVAIAQNTFGAYDPLPALNFARNGFLRGNLNEPEQHLYSQIESSASLEERHHCFAELEAEFDRSAHLMGLGLMSTQFISGPNVILHPELLITGELLIRSFQSTSP